MELNGPAWMGCKDSGRNSRHKITLSTVAPWPQRQGFFPDVCLIYIVVHHSFYLTGKFPLLPFKPSETGGKGACEGKDIEVFSHPLTCIDCVGRLT
jgi:hypothetical protein